MTTAKLRSHLSRGLVRHFGLITLILVTTGMAVAWIYATLSSVDATPESLRPEAWEEAANRFEGVAQQLLNLILVATGVKGGMVFEQRRNGG